MKKLIVIAILFAGLGSLVAQDTETLVIRKVEKKAVPGAVIASVETEYPQGIVEIWEAIPVEIFNSYYVVSERSNLKEGERVDHYQVTLKSDGLKTVAVYDAEGKLVQSREVINDARLPKSISSAIITNYPGWRIVGDKEVIRESENVEETYKVQLSKGKEKMTLIMDPDGKVLKEHKGKEAA